MLSGLGISFQNLNLLHFDQIISLKSLLTGSIKFGSSVDEAPGPSLTEGTVFREREREGGREKERESEKEGCLNSVRIYLPRTVLQWCSCLSGVATYLPGTMLQGCSCLSGVETFLPGLCCRGAAV